jgi:hypothetical protein
VYVKPNNSFSARANEHQVIVGDDVLALFNDAKKQGKKTHQDHVKYDLNIRVQATPSPL